MKNVFLFALALALFAGLAFAEEPAVVKVDDDWAAIPDATEVEPGFLIGTNAFATIGAGVGAVADGGEVIVADGAYGGVTIGGKAVTLTGSNAGIPANDPADAWAANPARVAEAVVDGRIYIDNGASGTTVDGFKIINGNCHWHNTDNSDITIINNWLVDPIKSGSNYYIGNHLNTTGSNANFLVADNRIEAAGPIGSNASGIAFWGHAGATVERNTIDAPIPWAGIQFIGGLGHVARGNHLRGIASKGLQYSPHLIPTGDILIEDNVFDDCGNGADIGAADMGGIVMAHHDGGANGAPVAPVTIRGNTFLNCNSAVTVAVPAWGPTVADLSLITVTGNTFTGNTVGVDNEGGWAVDHSATVLDARGNWWGDASGPSGVGPGTGDPVTANVLFDPWIGKAPVDMVYVDDDYAGLADGTLVDGHVIGVNAFATIQGGINGVTGSTVVVAAGDYTENVQINKSDLVLTGPNAEISPNDPADITLENAARVAEAVIHGSIKADGSVPSNVVIQGFKLDSAGGTIGDGGCIPTYPAFGDNLLVRNNWLHDPFVKGAQNAALGSQPPVNYPTTYHFVNNRVADLRVHEGYWARYGAYFHQVDDLLVQDCLFVGSPSSGIQIQDVSGALITGCASIDNGWRNIRFHGSGDGSSDTTVTNCMTRGAADNGILFTGAAWAGTIQVTGNDVADSEFGVFVSFDTSVLAEPLIIHYNSFANHSGAAVVSTSPAVIDARFNWWGDACGPGTVQPESTVWEWDCLNAPTDFKHRDDSAFDENNLSGDGLWVTPVDGSRLTLDTTPPNPYNDSFTVTYRAKPMGVVDAEWGTFAYMNFEFGAGGKTQQAVLFGDLIPQSDGTTMFRLFNRDFTAWPPLDKLEITGLPSGFVEISMFVDTAADTVTVTTPLGTEAPWSYKMAVSGWNDDQFFTFGHRGGGSGSSWDYIRVELFPDPVVLLDPVTGEPADGPGEDIASTQGDLVRFDPWDNRLDGDTNNDCKVNILDLIGVRNHLNQDPNSPPENQAYDVNGDGTINILDMIYVRNRLNSNCGCE